MISYVTIGTNDLERAAVFYDAVLAPLGGKRGPETERYKSWVGPTRGPMLMVMKPFDGEPATVGNGVMIALGAESPAVVDAVYKAALAAGGTDAGEPGERRPGLYVGYFRDLDGNKLDAISM
ncbi:MAG: VOC family protein [Gammaproteobacteria bacterium]|nr:VOC family protein [Gammaproteobacteria bacterium]MBQ0839584.1 VOC family protein [Gammaproteobacteria bacterium]